MRRHPSALRILATLALLAVPATAFTPSARAAAPGAPAAPAVVRTPTGWLSGNLSVESLSTTGALTTRAASGTVQVAYHTLGSSESELRPQVQKVSADGSFRFSVPAFRPGSRVVALVTAWTGGRVVGRSGLLTLPTAPGGIARLAGSPTVSVSLKASARKTALDVRPGSTAAITAVAPPAAPSGCTWIKYPGGPYTNLVPLWRVHTTSNVKHSFDYTNEANTHIQVGLEVEATKSLSITGSYSVANSSSTGTTATVGASQNHWIYGTYFYTYWFSRCFLADGSYRDNWYRTATQESWNGELLLSTTANDPKPEITSCLSVPSAYRVNVSKSSTSSVNTPWSRTTGSTSSYGFKIGFFSGGTLGSTTAITTTSKATYSLISNGTAYWCGRTAAPTTSGIIYTTH